MRTPLARLVGVAAAGALIISPLAVAGPANAAGTGIISVTIVDDLGKPVTAKVILYSADGGSPVELGLPDPGDDGIQMPAVPASSFVEEVNTGTYGAVAFGGWAVATCVGLTSCSPTAISAPGAPPTPGAGAVTVNEGAPTSLTITVATPKLTGTPGVGQPLTVSVPSSLSEYAAFVAALPAAGIGGLLAGLSSEPTITWHRAGSTVGATGKTYVPTAADAGSSINATVAYPANVAMLLGLSAPGTVPPPFQTAAVSINKLTPSIKLSVPGKIKLGKRPTAYVNVTSGQTLVGGVVTFTVGKRKSQQALRSGLATFKLPKLKAGKHKVTASFAAAGAYNAAKTTKTVVVKGKKPKKGKGKKK